MNITTYVIRTFGGVLVQNVPSTSILPSVMLTLRFRDGTTSVTFRG